MITVCEKCEYGLAGQRVTMCSDCGAEYHQRCWDSLDECPVCAYREELRKRSDERGEKECFICGGEGAVDVGDEMGNEQPCPNCAGRKRDYLDTVDDHDEW